MKHRDRVLTALNHEAPDRCPMQVSFTPEFAVRLRRTWASDDAQAAQPARRRQHLRAGTRPRRGYAAHLGRLGELAITRLARLYTDEWGIGWAVAAVRDAVRHRALHRDRRPSAGRRTRRSRQLPAARPEPPRAVRRRRADARQDFKDEYWIVGVTVTTIFETAWALRGLEQMLMDLAGRPGPGRRILDIPYHYHLTAAKKLVEMGVDMIWIGDDVGTQNGMLISPGDVAASSSSRAWRTSSRS